MNDILQCKICLGNLRGPIVGNFFVCDQCSIHYNTVVQTKKALKQSLCGMMLTACSSPQKMQKRINKAHQQFDIITPHISTGKLYDVGAAGGFVMKTALDRGWDNVYGNELSQAAVYWAKRTYNISIFNGFLEDDPVATASTFDLIIFWNTLEHMIDPVVTLALATKMLKPQGYMHIRVPTKTEANIIEFHEKGHTVEFSQQSLEILRSKNNLEEIIQLRPESRIPCIDLLWRKQ